MLTNFEKISSITFCRSQVPQKTSRLPVGPCIIPYIRFAFIYLSFLMDEDTILIPSMNRLSWQSYKLRENSVRVHNLPDLHMEVAMAAPEIVDSLTGLGPTCATTRPPGCWVFCDIVRHWTVPLSSRVPTITELLPGALSLSRRTSLCKHVDVIADKRLKLHLGGSFVISTTACETS
jgi:hypothetical protein